MSTAPMMMAPPQSWTRRVSTFFYSRSHLYVLVVLLPPLLWLGILYLGSLFNLLIYSVYKLDDFSGQVVREFSLRNFVELLRLSNVDIIVRTVTMALLVTIGCACVAFPIAYTMARYTSGKTRALFYLAVMLPLWSSYLVRVYAWKLILAKEGIIGWLFHSLGLDFVLDAILALPVIGGTSLSFSRLGTFIVFVYIWVPYMILPIQAALERIPKSYLEASSDLGAKPGQTFRNVIVPLAIPGIAAGSIFTFSLTLGDYIIPGIIGNSTLYLGQVVYIQQGTAGNIPLAAAFSVVPIVVIALYLWLVKRWGAFDAL